MRHGAKKENTKDGGGITELAPSFCLGLKFSTVQPSEPTHVSQSTADLLTVNSFFLAPKLIRPLRQKTGGGPQMYVVMFANQHLV